LPAAALLLASLGARGNEVARHVGGGRCECWQPNDIYCELPAVCTEVCLHTNERPDGTLETELGKRCDVNHEQHPPQCKPNWCFSLKKPDTAAAPPPGPAKPDADADEAARKKLAALFQKGAQPPQRESPMERNRARVKKLSDAYRLGGGEKNQLRPFEDTLTDAHLACLSRAKACRYTCSAQQEKCWDSRCRAPYDEAMRRARTEQQRGLAGLRLDLCWGECAFEGCFRSCDCTPPRRSHREASSEGKTAAE
jgi:hypothetical protein